MQGVSWDGTEGAACWHALLHMPCIDFRNLSNCYSNAAAPECVPPYDRVSLPLFAAALGDFSPFQSVQVDWMPLGEMLYLGIRSLKVHPKRSRSLGQHCAAGHTPEKAYGVPHFTVQFYLVPEGVLANITRGPCFCIANCGGLSTSAFAAANLPVPEACFPGGGFQNIGSATAEIMRACRAQEPVAGCVLLGIDGPVSTSIGSQGLRALRAMQGAHYVNFESPELRAMLAGDDGTTAWNTTFQWGGFAGQAGSCFAPKTTVLRRRCWHGCPANVPDVTCQTGPADLGLYV